MDVKPFPAPGMIEEYCLGLLSASQNEEINGLAHQYPEIEDEIHRVESTLLAVSRVPARPALRSRVLDTLAALAMHEAIDLENPPLIHSKSNYHAWNDSVRAIEPDSTFGSLKTKNFYRKNGVYLNVIWLTGSLTEDGHADDKFHESILILEGSCECNLNGRIVNLQAGDFLEIPADTHHIIKNTSTDADCLKALVQRVRKVA